MADVFTGVSALTNLVQTAYDKAAYWSLRPQLHFDAVADVTPTNQSMPGNVVVLNIVNDLAPVEATITESSDVSAVAMSSSQVSLTLGEYGNVVKTTGLLRGESFVGIDPVVAEAIGYNAGISLDGIARGVLIGGTNVAYPIAGGASSRATLTTSCTMAAADLLKVGKRLRAQSVAPIGNYYACFLHPNQCYDIQTATTITDWRQPHVYAAPEEIWSGEFGALHGFRIVETPRAPVFGGVSGSQFSGGTYSGSGTTTVYAGLFMGRQALAKAWSYVDGNTEFPSVVPGPITDSLRRTVPVGWYWLGAYGIFRQPALYRVESGSSLTDADENITEQ